MKRIKSEKIITPQGFFSGYVYYDEKGIAAVTAEELPFTEEVNASGKYVSPGFIDLHVHGGLGNDFSTCTAEQAAETVDFHLRHGTTGIYPTVTSVEDAVLCRALDTLRTCKAKNLCKAKIYGVHLEGPYFSPAQSGAQRPDIITPPVPEQYTRILRDYGDLVKRWSYAPELDEGAAFCRYLVSHGVVPAIGHSDAIYADCMRAYAAGCKLVTHLYSCTSTVTRDHGFRRPGVIETAYLTDGMAVEMIADGKHLPPELLRLIFKIKGADAVCLVTDAICAAGSTDPNPVISGMNCIVEDGVAKLPDRSAFAGSIATADQLVRVCVKEAGLPLLAAVRMITANPAKVMGIRAGVLEPGYPADLVIFDSGIRIEKVIVNGETV